MLLFGAAVLLAAAPPPTIRVTLPASHHGPALGRVRVYLSTSCGPNAAPPSQQSSDDQDTSQVFGVDTPAGGLLPGGSVKIDGNTLGYPRWSLGEVPNGKYCIQAELFRHHTYHMGDGTNLTLPKTCVSPGGGDGSYGSPPGTLYSPIESVELGLYSSGEIAISLTTEVPSSPSPGCSGTGADTEYIKTVSITSKLLSSFWGEPITLEACGMASCWNGTLAATARWPRAQNMGTHSRLDEELVASADAGRSRPTRGSAAALGVRRSPDGSLPDADRAWPLLWQHRPRSNIPPMPSRQMPWLLCSRRAVPVLRDQRLTATSPPHYTAIFNPGGRFDKTPPTPNMTGYAYVDQLYANYFYHNWTSASGPYKGARALVVTINHPVPFFDDSYAVDSAVIAWPSNWREPWRGRAVRIGVPHTTVLTRVAERGTLRERHHDRAAARG